MFSIATHVPHCPGYYIQYVQPYNMALSICIIYNSCINMVKEVSDLDAYLRMLLEIISFCHVENKQLDVLPWLLDKIFALQEWH